MIKKNLDIQRGIQIQIANRLTFFTVSNAINTAMAELTPATKKLKQRGPIQIDEIYDAILYDPSKSAEQRRLEVIALASRFESLGYKLINDKYGRERPIKFIAKDIYHLSVNVDPMKYVMHSNLPANKQTEALLDIVEFYNTQYGANIITRLNPLDINDKRLRSFSEISDDLYLKSDQIFKNLRSNSKQLSSELYRAVDALTRSKKFLTDEHQSKQNLLLNRLGKLMPAKSHNSNTSFAGGADTPDGKTDTDDLLDELRALKVGLTNIRDRAMYLSGDTTKLPPEPVIPEISISGSGKGDIIKYEDTLIANTITDMLNKLDEQLTKKLDYIKAVNQEVFRTGNKLDDLERITRKIAQQTSGPERSKYLAYVMSNIELQRVKNKKAVEKLLDIIRSEDLEGSPIDSTRTILAIIDRNPTKLFSNSAEYREVHDYLIKLYNHLSKTELDLSQILPPEESRQFIDDLSKTVQEDEITDSNPHYTALSDDEIAAFNNKISEAIGRN